MRRTLDRPHRGRCRAVGRAVLGLLGGEPIGPGSSGPPSREPTRSGSAAAGSTAATRSMTRKSFCRITEPAAIRALSENLRFEADPDLNCMCCGYPGIDWYRNGKRIVLASRAAWEAPALEGLEVRLDVHASNAGVARHLVQGARRSCTRTRPRCRTRRSSTTWTSTSSHGSTSCTWSFPSDARACRSRTTPLSHS